ncbi:MAG: class I SAM-dependent methyltransferase [Acidobacteriaceae bacterium]|nr:class I SAM-dependent methyltransferase [Acidobacteriaceae bacterium]
MWLGTRGLGDPVDFANRLAPDLPLQGHLRKLLPGPEGTTYRILDLGAGPLTTLGKVCDGQKLELVCIDPLASVYDILLNANGIAPPVRTQYGEAEQIAEMFPDNSFHLVHAANSLDHAHDPVAAIKAALHVVRPGAYVFLEHILNEGDRERYGGLHQWNFGEDAGCFTVTSKRGKTINVTNELAGVAHVNQTVHEIENAREGGTLALLTVTIQKI